MRKKFNALQKDIEAQKEEIKNLFEQVGWVGALSACFPVHSAHLLSKWI